MGPNSFSSSAALRCAGADGGGAVLGAGGEGSAARADQGCSVKRITQKTRDRNRFIGFSLVLKVHSGLRAWSKSANKARPGNGLER
jgi:hypothetical protein